MSFDLTGKSIIGFRRGVDESKAFRAFDPKTGDEIEPYFFSATTDELSHAVQSASEARVAYGRTSGKDKAAFLRKIAENIEALGNVLTNRASLETALATARLEGERARTCLQLRMFADLVEEGSWADARIDTGGPERKPTPKPDVRSMLRPVGTVGVFCASNFPLAFSVAGGDTASAFAAGCPVIVIAHTAHPGTAEHIGAAIMDAVKTCGLPEGTFNLLFANDYAIGQALVKHPDVKAIGFTGSRTGGKALMDIAASRQEPIPVYAEMSSINPTFILPTALAEKPDVIATGLFSSFTMGAGQFCTKPGLVLVPESRELPTFIKRLEELSNESDSMYLLAAGIHENYHKGVLERAERTAESPTQANSEGFSARPRLFHTSAESFLSDPKLSEEIFGPTTLVVSTSSREELMQIARNMEGQLTAAIFGTAEDLEEYSALIEVLETKVGRLIFNGFPTGVEVCHAMVHGGVYPATSDSRSTSVGTRAINRFVRLVCYQDFPQNSLPDELKDKNPLGISRLQNGEITRQGLR